MSLVFREIHAAPEETNLNQELFVLENTGTAPFNSAGCAVMVNKKSNGPKKYPRPLGNLDPGFVLKPGQKIRVVTGSPGKKAQGTPPAESDDLKNYHLFLAGSMLLGPGCEIRLALRQHEVARGVFDPAAKTGVQG